MTNVFFKKGKNLFVILMESYGLVAYSLHSLAVLIAGNLINLRMIHNLEGVDIGKNNNNAFC